MQSYRKENENLPVECGQGFIKELCHTSTLDERFVSQERVCVQPEITGCQEVKGKWQVEKAYCTAVELGICAF